ncbi:unnamed protein product [Linum trigynum]|uniref:Uncharacterized protein n=1 Tax=Linum trigynum TaxID=586398 RepID=A0AAV2D7J0_9ROSI
MQAVPCPPHLDPALPSPCSLRRREGGKPAAGRQKIGRKTCLLPAGSKFSTRPIYIHENKNKNVERTAERATHLLPATTTMASKGRRGSAALLGRVNGGGVAGR